MNPKRVEHLPAVPAPAWHGPIGDAVREIAPTTEGDPVAVLAQILALFGALVGDGPHVRVGGVDHPPRLWPLIIGKTSAGRKGTGLAAARSFVNQWSPYAHQYLRHRVTSGLASGEGLLASLGAAREATGKGKPEDQPEPIAPDGKLTVVEPEFTRVLAASKREGSTLGQILRELWDSGHAGIMTRGAPLSVTDAHLTVIAHATPRELKLRLTESDLVGGTANRFLMIASERPHLLYDEMTHPDVAKLARVLGEAVENCKLGVREVRRDRPANALWRDVYASLAADEPDGPLGAVLARGPAYTMRLALLYALADGVSAIAPDHLLAGLALWHYSAQTARLIFSDSRRLNEHQRLAAFIAGARSRTATEVNDFFGRNKTAEEIKAIVGELEAAGDVTRETDNDAGRGRPVVRFFYTGVPTDAVSELLLRNGTHETTN
jgi:hypothetical protein